MKMGDTCFVGLVCYKQTFVVQKQQTTSKRVSSICNVNSIKLKVHSILEFTCAFTDDNIVNYAKEALA